jgi:formate dehydrogenase accessory protein FdhD
MSRPPRITRPVPEEPVRLVVNGRSLSTWTASPAALEDLAAGRLLTAGFVRDRDEIVAIHPPERRRGVHEVRVDVTSAAAERGWAERAHRAEHGCGLRHLLDCRPPGLPVGRAPDLPALDRFPDLFRELFDRSPSRETTGGHHTAALTGPEAIAHVYEEIGRHNAVDKAIGGALLAGDDLEGLGLLTTARISGEMAEKAARAGLAWVASRSVPTTLAAEIAAAAGLPLVARAPGRDAAILGSAGAPLGAVLAGGESRRFGAPKALARVGGRRIVDRVVAALEQVTPELALSANEPELFADLDLPPVPDARPGLGPLAGIHAMLLEARARGRPGILAVACDMPFPSLALLERLRAEAFDAPRGAGGPDPARWPDVVVPESRGRRGIEPLFAAYRTTCLPAIEAALEAGDRRMMGFHEAVETRRIPLAEVERLCDPGRAFLNVNTPGELERAESMVERDEGAR